MATKKKQTKKTASKKSSSSYNTHHHEQNTFILIAGGGLVVLFLTFMLMNGFGFNNVEQIKETVKQEVQDVDVQREETVAIKDFAYAPETLTVKAGTTVTFTNEDAVSHNAKADDGSFDTGLLAKGESGSVTFSEAGTYTYHCTPHPNMTGTIIVEE